MSNASPCNECPFKQSIPGDCHSACGHPVAVEKQMLLMSLVFTGRLSVIKQALGLQIDPHAVSQGWANFPMNFDPIWVTGSCSMLDSYKQSVAKFTAQREAELIHKEA